MIFTHVYIGIKVNFDFIAETLSFYNLGNELK